MTPFMLCVHSEPRGSTPKLRDPATGTRCAMNNPRDWRTLYATAMLEGDQTQVRPRIEKAQEAIHARMRELPQSSLSARNRGDCSWLFRTFAA